MSETEYVLVPREATAEMMDAMFDVARQRERHADGGVGYVQLRAAWDAAIAASPAPAASRKDTLDYEGVLADLESALEVLVRRINGEKGLNSAATWLALNYPTFAKKWFASRVYDALPEDVQARLAALPDAPVPAKDGEGEGQLANNPGELKPALQSNEGGA